MIASVVIEPEKWYNSVHEMIRMALIDYQILFKQEEKADLFLWLQVKEEKGTVSFLGQIQEKEDEKRRETSYSFVPDSSHEQKKEISRNLRIFVFEWMSEFLGRSFSDYGILSGVRPLKILHRCLDQGLESEKITDYMVRNFRTLPDKARFLLEVAKNNHFLLPNKEEAGKKIGMYIGIPFCPTRCYYCSFPGAVLTNYEKEIPEFLKALKREIEAIGNYLQGKAYSLQNLYIGGGTPTVLREADLGHLLTWIREKLEFPAEFEFTVEAGRPDTITREKLKLLKEYGVNRICINPQTMQDQTLRRIGRKHSAGQIEEAVLLAKEAGMENINMDVIVGLPGEGKEDYEDTIKKILKIAPSNITVHSLAVKRGSVLAEKEGLSQVSSRAEEISEGMEVLSLLIRGQGYIPYYLYRQKYMKANMENTGYTLPGKQCLYNVQMMEERQTILGLGGGASSKFVHPKDWTLVNYHNPKDPGTYTSQINRYIEGKLERLKALEEC